MSQVYFVDSVNGDDTKTGAVDAPFKTLNRAVKILKAGDQIKVKNSEAVFNEMVMIKLCGAPGSPIIIDGNMATIELASLIPLSDWEKVDVQLFRRKLQKFDKETIKRYFLIIDGKVQMMNVISKLVRNPPLPPVEKLKENEWTFDFTSKYLYLKISEKCQLKDMAIQECNPKLSGFAIYGITHDLIIRNFIIQHAGNDGLNIHGKAKNILFENIISRYNADDGLSAHDDCEIQAENLIIIGNGSGICHINNVKSEHKNILLLENVGSDISIMSNSNRFENIIVLSNRSNLLDATGNAEFRNAYFANLPNAEGFRLQCPNIIFDNVYIGKRKILGKNTSVNFFTSDNDQGYKRGFIQETLTKLKNVFGKNYPNELVEKMLQN